VPESRRRKPKKVAITPAESAAAAAARARKAKAPSPRWVGAMILAMFAIGIVWLLIYYFSNGGVLGMEHLGGFNVLIGFGFLVVGLGVATQWK
jgi:hypothetical protein